VVDWGLVVTRYPKNPLLLHLYLYLVEHERMANAQLLMYGSKHLNQNFFFFVFLKKCEYPMVLSDLEDPPDLKIEVLFVKVTVFIVLLFASLRDCGQNQINVCDEQQSLSDF
jgi:hypothetical protein